jgi:hypothetical protein
MAGSGLAVLVAQHAVHGLAQGGGHFAQAGKGLLGAVHLGHVQAQADVADGGLLGVVGQAAWVS